MNEYIFHNKFLILRWRCEFKKATSNPGPTYTLNLGFQNQIDTIFRGYDLINKEKNVHDSAVVISRTLHRHTTK